MSILKVARMGHPVLRQVARELSVSEIRSNEIKQLIDDMIETMDEYGGIGLAAPQVHESVQLALIGYEDDNERYPDAGSAPLRVLFNPKITVLDPTPQAFWEGCLSVPGLRGLVRRPRKIRVDYLDTQGKPQSISPEGFLATVFQHELDHLAGVLYIDRIDHGVGKSALAFQEEYDRYLVPEADDEVGEMAD
jgi:peptide deformylase